MERKVHFGAKLGFGEHLGARWYAWRAEEEVESGSDQLNFMIGKNGTHK